MDPLFSKCVPLPAPAAVLVSGRHDRKILGEYNRRDWRREERRKGLGGLPEELPPATTSPTCRLDGHVLEPAAPDDIHHSLQRRLLQQHLLQAQITPQREYDVQLNSVVHESYDGFTSTATSMHHLSWE